MKNNTDIRQNIKAHDKIVADYEKLHGEIFNPVEQERLRAELVNAIAQIQTASAPKTALDFGCGSGNLTKHLIELGMAVVSADVSEKFLDLIKKDFEATGKSKTLKLNGEDLANLENDRFDLVAAYSVLHHIPDYLKIVKEIVRVTKPGGVIYFDHEVNENYWQPNPEYREFTELVKPEKSWTRFFKPSNYADKIRRLFNPRYQAQGDIHVWPDDHIEWDKIEKSLIENGCEIVSKKDYLLFKKHYPRDLYDKFKTRCADTRALIARKK